MAERKDMNKATKLGNLEFRSLVISAQQMPIIANALLSFRFSSTCAEKGLW